MTAVVAPPPLSNRPDEANLTISADGLVASTSSFSLNAEAARKRRRDILTVQRDTQDNRDSPKKRRTSADESSLGGSDSDSSEEKQRTTKKCGEVASTSLASSKKKPQMKYDPDVPMTKEEAAAWRREQRRKRNRESAAASRQRQRDRITELEGELDDIKAKFNEAMKRIRELEQGNPGALPRPQELHEGPSEMEEACTAERLAVKAAAITDRSLLLPAMEVDNSLKPQFCDSSLPVAGRRERGGNCGTDTVAVKEELVEAALSPSKMTSRQA